MGYTVMRTIISHLNNETHEALLDELIKNKTAIISDYQEEICGLIPQLIPALLRVDNSENMINGFQILEDIAGNNSEWRSVAAIRMVKMAPLTKLKQYHKAWTSAIDAIKVCQEKNYHDLELTCWGRLAALFNISLDTKDLTQEEREYGQELVLNLLIRLRLMIANRTATSDTFLNILNDLVNITLLPNHLEAIIDTINEIRNHFLDETQQYMSCILMSKTRKKLLQFDDSLREAEKAIELSLQMNNTERTIDSYINIASVYLEIMEPTLKTPEAQAALDAVVKSVEIASDKNPDKLSESYGIMGEIYDKGEDYASALEYFRKARDNEKATNEQEARAAIGRKLIWRGKIDHAKEKLAEQRKRILPKSFNDALCVIEEIDNKYNSPKPDASNEEQLKSKILKMLFQATFPQMFGEEDKESPKINYERTVAIAKYFRGELGFDQVLHPDQRAIEMLRYLNTFCRIEMIDPKEERGKYLGQAYFDRTSNELVLAAQKGFLHVYTLAHEMFHLFRDCWSEAGIHSHKGLAHDHELIRKMANGDISVQDVPSSLENVYGMDSLISLFMPAMITFMAQIYAMANTVLFDTKQSELWAECFACLMVMESLDQLEEKARECRAFFNETLNLTQKEEIRQRVKKGEIIPLSALSSEAGAGLNTLLSLCGSGGVYSQPFLSMRVGLMLQFIYDNVFKEGQNE